MKALTFTFVRDWQTSRSIAGTGEVELAPAGRGTDTATYVVNEAYEEALARAALLEDFSYTNPSNVVLDRTTDIKGIISVQRRIT